ATHDEGGHVLARDGLHINVGSFENVDGLISTQGAVNIVADSVTQAGSIEVERGDLQLTSRGDLSNSGIVASNGTIVLRTQTNLNQTGRIVSKKRIELSSDGPLTLGETSEIGGYDVALSGGSLTNAGLVEAQGEELTLNSRGDLSNSGIVASNGTIALRTQTNLNQTGRIVAQKRVELSSDGTLTLGATSEIGGYDVALSGGSLINAGLVEAQGEELTLNSHGDLSNSGIVASNGTIALRTQTNLNQTGRIVAQKRVELSSDGTLTLGATSEVGGYDVALSGGILTNAGLVEAQGEELTLNSHGDLSNSGIVASNGTIALRTQTNLNQTGRIVAQKRIELSSDGTLTLGATSEVGGYDVALSGGIFTNAGLVEAQGGELTLNSHGLLSNQGTMVGGVVDAKLGFLTNSGQFLSQGAFTLVAANHDPLLGQTALVLNASGGVLKSGGAFVLTTDALNNAGILGSGGDAVALNVSGDMSNSGLIYAKKSATLSLDGDFINQFGDVIAEDNLIIRGLKGERAGHVINSSGLLEAVSGDMHFDVSALTNIREGGVEVSDKVVSHRFVSGQWEGTNVKHHQIKEDVDTTIIRQQAHFKGNAAQILVGRHLTVNAGDIRNSYSLISANGNIEMRGDTLLNEGRDLIETTKIVTETHRRKKHCTVLNGGCQWGGIEYYGSTINSKTLMRTYDAVYGTIEAGGTLDAKLTGYIDNHAVREGGEQVGLSSGNKGLAGVNNTDFGVSKPLISLSSDNKDLDVKNIDFDVSKPLISDDRLDGIINGLTGHKALFAPSIQTPTSESIQVSKQDGLSSVQTELTNTQKPDVPFLVETRPDFINPSKFLGSDYYLKKIGNYKPEHVFKKLGDAYYEYRLVSEQIFELTGDHTLLDVADPNAQMQRLYDNAIAQQGPLGLELGVPLSPQQIAGIKKDMIWLETHVVNGQEVLVPRVYLAPNSSLVQDAYEAKTQQASLASAHLKGHGVTLEAEHFTNSGTILSDGVLNVSTTQTLLNDGGFLLSRDVVDLNSQGLFVNSSGVILGDVITLTAQTIVDGTAKIRDTNEYGFVDRIGQQSQIISLQNLNILSLGDLSMNGGQWNSGGSMTVTAGGSATLGSLVLESENKQSLEKGHYDAQSSYHHLAQVNSDGDLIIVTGGDLNLAGKFKAKGDADFTSGGALSAVSEQDFNSFDLDLRGKEGDKSKQKNKFREQSTEVTTTKTTIETGGNLSMNAKGGDLTLDAVEAKIGGQTHLKADRKIKFLTNKDQDFKDTYQRNENLVWWSEDDKGYLKETIEHVTIDAKGGMKLDAGDGIVVEYEAT
ncbi:hemagglutinin repeat-containing protein, partial [Bartonella sp. ML70XJBT.G]|uniref:hemagglutinin repeat-containing protein n=1 Tax=Bartonella sp. ML70XJBT.G TaxID=3019093 RepID=UPI002361AF61